MGCLKQIGPIPVSASGSTPVSQSPTAVDGGSFSIENGNNFRVNNKLMQITELPETVKKEDLKQLKNLLPNASECFIASLLPFTGDIFAAPHNYNSEPMG